MIISSKDAKNFVPVVFIKIIKGNRVGQKGMTIDKKSIDITANPPPKEPKLRLDESSNIFQETTLDC